ncbi:MAG: DNA recombination protein RmuC [Chloroflexi bacterium]|nr:DNA recombination protein RmuC [Chloroflexota bacterium]
MDWLPLLISFSAGTIIGAIVTFFIVQQSEKKRRTSESALADTMKNAFSTLSLDALDKSTNNLLKLAEEKLKSQTVHHTTELESKKQLIDQRLETIDARLGKVADLVSEFENSRAERLGALGKELENLTRTSSQLHDALANNRSRGQWGERIADDILRLAGFIEGVNYTKQTTVDTNGSRKTRPDFSFKLPNNVCLNMDSKFPLDNYMHYLKAQAEVDKDNYRKKFLADVRGRVREVGCERSKDYINSDTVDCVLVFIPNEQVYRFIHEEDDTIIEEALKQKVIICSPLTLYIVLAVIRQAAENFKLEQSSREVLKLLNEFKKQWTEYTGMMEKIGGALEKAREAYDDLVGKRRTALEKPLNKIDGLLEANGITETAVLAEVTKS